MDSQVVSVAAVESALKDVVDTFRLNDIIPGVCCHTSMCRRRLPICIRERWKPCFRVLPEPMPATRPLTSPSIRSSSMHDPKGKRYGLYFETGQGSEFTNGADNGVDMMVLESRKYGFSRAVARELAKVQPEGAWLHVNDVAGFIGPEVFRPGSSWSGAVWRTLSWQSCMD